MLPIRPATVLARILNSTTRTRRVKQTLARRHTRVLLTSKGRRLNRWFGAPVLILETIGRRTGAPRSTPLIYLDDPHGFVVIPANGGADTVPSWWLNLCAAGTGTVLVGNNRSPIVPRLAEGAERDRLWSAFSAMYPTLQDYRSMTSRKLPVVILERVR